MSDNVPGPETETPGGELPVQFCPVCSARREPAALQDGLRSLRLLYVVLGVRIGADRRQGKRVRHIRIASGAPGGSRVLC
jgi:hypothetical protein